MNLKFEFFVVVVLHSFLWQECYSRPFWGYLFAEDETPPTLNDSKTDTASSNLPTNDPISDKKSKSSGNTKRVEEKSAKLVADSAPTNGANMRSAKSPGPSLNERPTQMTLMGGIVHLLGRTVDGTRQLVDRGTDTVSGTIKNVATTYSRAVDDVTGAIDRGGQQVDDRINSWIKMFDASRRMLSGTVKKNADQGHSFTIKMSSDAPMNSLTGLLSGGSAWPEVTGFETNLFG